MAQGPYSFASSHTFLELSLLLFAFTWLLFLAARAFRSCMVHVKFTARPQTSVVSPKFSSMA
jgi:hypothetical protein